MCVCVCVCVNEPNKSIPVNKNKSLITIDFNTHEYSEYTIQWRRRLSFSYKKVTPEGVHLRNYLSKSLKFYYKIDFNFF